MNILQVAVHYFFVCLLSMISYTKYSTNDCRCSVVHTYVDQGLGAVLLSSSWKDYNTFGHVGAPLMGFQACVESYSRDECEYVDVLISCTTTSHHGQTASERSQFRGRFIPGIR